QSRDRRCFDGDPGLCSRDAGRHGVFGSDRFRFPRSRKDVALCRGLGDRKMPCANVKPFCLWDTMGRNFSLISEGGLHMLFRSDLWEAVALGITAENKKIEIFVRHNLSRGIA